MGTLTGSIIGDWLSNAFYGILLTIDYVVYLAINLCYQLFEVVGKIEVFSTDSVAEISHKIYMIIGIVMLFVFAYNIILGIIDPDSLNKGDKSFQNVVKNTVISVVLVTLFPLICEYMQTFQNHVIEDKTISNLLLGSTVSDKSALSVSTTIFTAFYHPLDENKNPVTLDECETSSAKLCPRYKELADEAKNSLSGLWNLMHDSDLKDGIADDNMQYLFPLSTIAGIVAAYLFLSFSLDLGVRAAKLGALKLVAPIPIFLRITKPKGGQFDKWLSEFTKTYLQVFERIIIINFAMLLISYVSKIKLTEWLITSGESGAAEPSVFIKLLAIVVVILGILKFAKDAPKLLEDLFNVKIPQMSLKKKINDNELALRGASALGAAGLTAAGNVIKGIGTGKGFGGVLKTGIGGLAGGARQGWVQSRGLNDITKLKGTISGARATADEHRDDREAQSRGLAEDWLTNQIKEIREEHPDWNDAQVEQYIEENKLREKAKWHGTVIDRTRDRVFNTGKDFANYMTSGGDSILQRSYASQEKLKKRAGDFIKNQLNKGDYADRKSDRQSLISDANQGKISARELAARLSQISGKSAAISGMSLDINGAKHQFNTSQEKINAIKDAYGIDLLGDEQYKDLRDKVLSGKINNNELLETLENLTGKQGTISADSLVFDGTEYDINSETGRKKAIEAAFKQQLDSAQIANLKSIGAETCANYANTLSKEFGELALSIDDETLRRELGDKIDSLVNASKNLNSDDDYLTFAKDYEAIEKQLKKSTNVALSKLLDAQSKKDGK